MEMLTGLKIDLTPRTGKLGDFGEFTLTRVETETQEQLWSLLVGTWHYLGAPRIIGPRIKYLIMLGAPAGGNMSAFFEPLIVCHQLFKGDRTIPIHIDPGVQKVGHGLDKFEVLSFGIVVDMPMDHITAF